MYDIPIPFAAPPPFVEAPPPPPRTPGRTSIEGSRSFFPWAPLVNPNPFLERFLEEARRAERAGPPAAMPEEAARVARIPEDEPARLPPMVPGLPMPPPAMPAAPRRTTPAVGPGAAATSPAATPPTPAQPAAADAGDGDLWRRLMAFGFGMAASSSPGLFGGIGAGGQALLTSDREREQQQTRRLIAEAEADYRRRIAGVQERQLVAETDPAGLRGQLIRAQIEQARANAAAAGRGAWTPFERDNGNLGLIQSATGEIRDVPGRRPGTAAQADAAQGRLLSAYNTARANILRALPDLDPLTGAQPTAIERRRAEREQALRQIDQAFRMQGLNLPAPESGGGAAAAPDQPPVRSYREFTSPR